MHSTWKSRMGSWGFGQIIWRGYLGLLENIGVPFFVCYLIFMKFFLNLTPLPPLSASMNKCVISATITEVLWHLTSNIENNVGSNMIRFTGLCNLRCHTKNKIIMKVVKPASFNPSVKIIQELWKPLNGISLELGETDHIIQMIKISESSPYIPKL